MSYNPATPEGGSSVDRGTGQIIANQYLVCASHHTERILVQGTPLRMNKKRGNVCFENH